ncbi:hypothetical protein EYF80_053771 [Liparis tanakae]|uniref:Uncharacterized protein n=1 Tax=Liparis tanakae TaxID=230148 RepID=A0A4Z2F4J3_9TELE|nr:hypothetical protein EYF80_053771 [Liparis tanakae]
MTHDHVTSQNRQRSRWVTRAAGSSQLLPNIRKQREEVATWRNEKSVENPSEPRPGPQAPEDRNQTGTRPRPDLWLMFKTLDLAPPSAVSQ